MGLLDKYLTLKNSLKLNNAVMKGVAKAISSKAEEEFKQYLDSGLPSFENNLPYKDKSHEDFIKAEPLNKSSDILPKQKLTQKRDFDSVMSLMKENKSVEDNNEYQLTLGVIDKFYNSHLNDEYIEKEKIKLCCTSETELFKSLLFWGLYFIVSSCFAKSAKNDNEVKYGNKALEIFIKTQYPDFAQWLDTAKSKYKESDIFTNTKSESLLRFFYDGLTYSQELRPEEIIASLMSFRNDLTKEFEQLCKAQLTEKCISHPQKTRKQEKRAKDDSFLTKLAIIILFLCYFAVFIYCNYLNKLW